MRYVVSLFVFLASTALLAQPRKDPEGARVVAFVPVALPEAVAEFERVCLAHYFRTERFNQSIASSKWRYREEQGFGTPKPLVQRSPEALVIFYPAPIQEARTFDPAQCNFDFALQSQVPREEMLEAIRKALVRTFSISPAKYDFPGETCFRWTTEDRVRRVCLIGTVAKAQHVPLSYQLWTPVGEQRAGLRPKNAPPDPPQSQEVTLLCDAGPIERQFGGGPWKIYSCSDHSSLVIRSANSSSSLPFTYVLRRVGSRYAIGGSGVAGEGTDIAAATRELNLLSLKDFDALIEETRSHRGKTTIVAQ